MKAIPKTPGKRGKTPKKVCTVDMYLRGHRQEAEQTLDERVLDTVSSELGEVEKFLQQDGRSEGEDEETNGEDTGAKDEGVDSSTATENIGDEERG